MIIEISSQIFESLVLLLVTVKITAFWDVIPNSMAGITTNYKQASKQAGCPDMLVSL
jgi:hypothetical protein